MTGMSWRWSKFPYVFVSTSFKDEECVSGESNLKYQQRNPPQNKEK